MGRCFRHRIRENLPDQGKCLRVVAMASENDPGRPSGSEAERPSELAGLEARVGHLELELAALKRRIDGAGATQAAAVRVAPPVRATAPLPPPPPPAGVVSGRGPPARPGVQRPVFEAWPSASSRPAAVPISDSRSEEHTSEL